MLKNCTIDNVSHEHLCYYSLRSLIPVFEAARLSIFDVQLNDVNGGSVRVYATHREKFRPVSDRVFELVRDEARQGLDSFKTYENFSALVKNRLDAIDALLLDAKDRNEVIYAYGASTRGTVLIQLLKNSHVLRGVAERDPLKWGRVMVSSWLPIVSEEEARKNATVFFILPYHFLPGIIQREKVWMQGGGKLLVPLPEPRLLSVTDVHREWIAKGA